VKSGIKQIIKISIMVGILYYLYQKGLLDFTKVSKVISDPAILIFGILCMLSTALISVYRWRLLLAGQNIQIPFVQALKLTFIGMFFNTALPGAVSGDVVKGYYIVKQQPDGKGKSKAFATLLFDRIFGVSALSFIAFMAMLLNFSTMKESTALSTLVGFISILFAGVVLFYAFILLKTPLSKKIHQILEKMPAGSILGKVFEAVKCYEDHPAIIFKGLLVSMVIHSIIIGFITLLASRLGGFDTVSLSNFFLLTPLGLLVTAVPVAPAGLGTGHAAFYALYELVGAVGGADLFTAFVAFQILVNLSGGIFYVRYKQTAHI